MEEESKRAHKIADLMEMQFNTVKEKELVIVKDLKKMTKELLMLYKVRKIPVVERKDDGSLFNAINSVCEAAEPRFKSIGKGQFK